MYDIFPCISSQIMHDTGKKKRKKYIQTKLYNMKKKEFELSEHSTRNRRNFHYTSNLYFKTFSFLWLLISWHDKKIFLELTKRIIFYNYRDKNTYTTYKKIRKVYMKISNLIKLLNLQMFYVTIIEIVNIT